MQIFKFGGASVKDAEGLRNLSRVIQKKKNSSLLVVISAMGKTTNKLEELLNAYVHQQAQVHEIFEEIKDYHEHILDGLLDRKSVV